MHSQSLTKTATRAHALLVKCGTMPHSVLTPVLAVGPGMFSNNCLLAWKFFPQPLSTKGKAGD